MTLPPELQIQILSLLPPTTQIVASRVCTLWQTIIYTEDQCKRQRYTPPLGSSHFEELKLVHTFMEIPKGGFHWIAPVEEGGQWKYWCDWGTRTGHELESVDISGSPLLDERVICWRHGEEIRSDDVIQLDLEVFSQGNLVRWRKLEALDGCGENGLTIRRLAEIIVREMGDEVRGQDLSMRSLGWKDHGRVMSTMIMLWVSVPGGLK
ncbi:hypothetical protein TWF281_010139 [Arthrobotrys megalospora]